MTCQFGVQYTLPLLALLVLLIGSLGSASAQVVDSSTLDGKIICGYQGWFACPGDGNDPSIGWRHWSKLAPAMGPVFFNTDTWPDTSEYDPEDLFEVPNTTLQSGATPYLFSSAKQGVVDVHFRWMREYGIDGILLERFTMLLAPGTDAPVYRSFNTVIGNVKSSANSYGRVWAVEYDVTGDTDLDTIYDRISGDWQYLKRTLGVYRDAAYLRHDGKPTVTIFGFGFRGDNYPVDPALALRIIDYFKSEGCYVIGGVPWGWRTLTAGSKTDPRWADVFRSLNGIKPWTVGSYRDEAAINRFRENIWAPDIVECNRLGISYLPTAWPRFGWDNMHNYPCGQSKISSSGGQHFWDQVYAMRMAGAKTIYGAMFDEYDESTAMMKMSDDVPTEGCWWTNEGMPNDWHLRLLGCAGKVLRNEMRVSKRIPIKP